MYDENCNEISLVKLHSYEQQQIKLQNENNLHVSQLWDQQRSFSSCKTNLFIKKFLTLNSAVGDDKNSEIPCGPCLATHCPKLRVTRPAAHLRAVGASNTSQLRNDLSQSETANN